MLVMRCFGLRHLRTHVQDSFGNVHWSDARRACRCEGSSQRGHLIGITNTSFLQQAECKTSGKQARDARSANAAELQAAAGAEGKLTCIRLSP